MTSVYFDVGEGVGVIPLEVYDRDLVLVDRILSYWSIDLEPGPYFVIGHLPDGDELRTAVEVGRDAYENIRLKSQAQSRFSRAPHWRSSSTRSILGSWRVDDSALLGYTRTTQQGWRPVAELPLRALLESPLEMNMLTSDALGSSRPDALVLRQPDAPSVCVRIPGGRVDYFRFALRQRNDGRLDFNVGLAHPGADKVSKYLYAGLIGSAAQLAGLVAHSELVLESAENLLREKRQDPVAAAAAAYALLRVGNLERLHGWTQNLSEWFEWLPDGLVARAEHAAQEGNHDHALEQLRQLPRRGLPCLSIGLGYAVDRLRTYARLLPEDEELESLLEHLTAYAIATDFTAPVTTFLGEAPDGPDWEGPLSTPYRPTPDGPLSTLHHPGPGDASANATPPCSGRADANSMKERR